MKVPLQDIYEFHRIRTKCHVDSVNYFASLLGYQFPEHDNDKNIEPMRTGYAYTNYASYHSDFKMLPEYKALFEVAHSTHHEHAAHHVRFYNKDASKIPFVHIIEMVCDWFSSNFEQKCILHDCKYKSVLDWFDKHMADLNWTDEQLHLIRETANFLERHMDHDAVMQIWKDTLDK